MRVIAALGVVLFLAVIALVVMEQVLQPEIAVVEEEIQIVPTPR